MVPCCGETIRAAGPVLIWTSFILTSSANLGWREPRKADRAHQTNLGLDRCDATIVFAPDANPSGLRGADEMQEAECRAVPEVRCIINHENKLTTPKRRAPRDCRQTRISLRSRDTCRLAPGSERVEGTEGVDEATAKRGAKRVRPLTGTRQCGAGEEEKGI